MNNKCWLCGGDDGRIRHLRGRPFMERFCDACAVAMVAAGFLLDRDDGLPIRRACRERQPLSGVDAQALEGALQQCEKRLEKTQSALRDAMSHVGTFGFLNEGEKNAAFARWTAALNGVLA